MEGKILIVEDEEKLAAVLGDYLRQSGFSPFLIADGGSIIPWVREHRPDLILLDLMLPGRDGMEICKEIRTFSAVPIIMVTARIEEIDRLLGLELGADDYICKPFSPRQVVARAKAVLRRSREDIFPRILETGPFSLNIQSREVIIHNTPLKITPNEYGILKALMTAEGRVFSRTELVGMVQGYEFEGYNRTIDAHIKNLRKKIAEHLPDRDVIHSVYGTGYRFSLDTD